MKNNAQLVYSFFLLVGDFLALTAAFTLAYVLRVSFSNEPFISISSGDYIRFILLLLPLALLIFGQLGLYNKIVYQNRFSEIGRLLMGSFIAILLIISYGYLANKTIFPARLVSIYALVFSFIFVVLFRTIARAVRKAMFGIGIGVNNVLIVGNNSLTHGLIEALAHTRLTGYRIVGIVGGTNKYTKGYAVFSDFKAALKGLKRVGIHSIIQTELFSDNGKNNSILEYAQKNHVAYRFSPGNADMFNGKIDVDLFKSFPMIAVHQTALIGWGRIVKRLFDVVVGSILLIFALPVIGLFCLYFYLFDGGDPIFGQTRLSRFGSKVKIYKFRSYYHAYNRMTPEKGFEKLGKPELAKKYRKNGDFLENDPRISPVGRFLRKTSLDELPQLFNVVRGDISLVGPRALEPFELEQYDKKSLILSVKTGLTGLAVISGRRDIPIEERRKLDIYYVQNWSFWGDIVILAKTISVVLFHKGAK